MDEQFLTTSTQKPTIIGGYNIIDVTNNPVLKELREQLFNKNPKAFDLMEMLDTSGILKSEGFDNWGMLINDALKNSEYILFSSDKPQKTYGRYNQGDVIKAIGDLLSKIKKSSLNNVLKDQLSRMLKNLLKDIVFNERENGSGESNEIYKRRIADINEVLSHTLGDDIKGLFDSLNDLTLIFNGLEFTESIWGIHIDGNGSNNPTGPFVILFLNNILGKPLGNEIFDINELYNTYPNINIDIERTYVHELFHMIHLGMELLASNNDYADLVVIEGLARYFETYYSELNFLTDAQTELNHLKRYYSVVSYPYVGACYIDCFGQPRFGEIVEKSTHPDHMGAHCLLQGTKELDIIIKNL